MNLIKLKLKTVTPLCQIDGNDKKGGIDTITIKKIPVIYEDSMIVDVPVITGNGFRGLLRRVASTILFEEAMKKGIKIKPTDFHLMFAGGGNNFQSQPFEIEEKVRSLNPVISLFGASLAIESKIITPNLVPEDYMIKVIEKDDEVYAFSQLTQTLSFIKVDDILERTKFGRLLSKEDIEAWEKFVNENQAKRKKARENETDKVKKETIKSYLQREFVIPGTTFVSTISFKYSLTDIEYGLLIEALKRITNETIGGVKNLGFGIMEYNILFDNGSLIKSTPKPKNLFSPIKDIVFFEREEKAIEKFNNWLNDLKEENIAISKIMV